jgi:hypothetical protein
MSKAAEVAENGCHPSREAGPWGLDVEGAGGVRHHLDDSAPKSQLIGARALLGCALVQIGGP